MKMKIKLKQAYLEKISVQMNKTTNKENKMIKMKEVKEEMLFVLFCLFLNSFDDKMKMIIMWCEHGNEKKIRIIMCRYVHLLCIV